VEDVRRHAFEHRIRFDECGSGGLIRAGGYLRLMQDLAWRHSERLGLGRAWYRTNRLAWLVRHADLRITGQARSGDTLHVTTRVVGWRRVWARRESRASVDGVEVARATIDWVLIDEAGRLARIPADVAERFTDGVPGFQPARLALPLDLTDPVTRAWSVSIRDLDPMRHVNNATYLDVIDETLAADSGMIDGPRPPVRYQVEYLRPALPRMTVSVVQAALEHGTAFRFLDPDDQELVRARLTPG
jgi:acyl-CoA thioesterase FadM